MATVTKTAAGTWKALVRKQGWPVTIKTFRTKRDAEDWARRVEDEIVRGVYIERSSSERLTLAAALARYLAEVTPTKKSTTQDGERKKAKTLTERLGAYSLAALTPEVIARYRDERLAEGRRANTVRLELALLSHLFTIAIKEWRLGLVMNPVANIRKPTPAAGRNRRLTSKEESPLLAACDAHSNPMLGWIVRLGVETAMRKSEITSLRRGDVDLKRRIARVSDTKNGSAKTVPLTKAATNILAAALNHPVRPIDTDLIFFGETGRDGRRKPYAFERAWDQTKKRLHLGDFHFHDLRHEATSRLVERGFSDQQVSAITGHKSMQMVKRYTHLRAEDLVAKLDETEVKPSGSRRKA